MSEYQVGDQFKFRLDGNHMWFEVVEVLPDRYKAGLRNTPFSGQFKTSDGKVHTIVSEYQWGDVIEISKAELLDYETERRARGLA